MVEGQRSFDRLSYHLGIVTGLLARHDMRFKLHYDHYVPMAVVDDLTSCLNKLGTHLCHVEDNHGSHTDRTGSGETKTTVEG